MEKEYLKLLFKRIEEKEEIFIVNGVETILKLTDIVDILEKLEEIKYESEPFNNFIDSLILNIEYALNDELELKPIINKKYYIKELEKLKEFYKNKIL